MSTCTDFCSGFHVFKSLHFTASGLQFATFWDRCQMAQHKMRPFKERGHAFSVSLAPEKNLHPRANHGNKSFCLCGQRVGIWDLVNLLGDRTREWTKKKLIRAFVSLGLCNWLPGIHSYPSLQSSESHTNIAIALTYL